MIHRLIQIYTPRGYKAIKLKEIEPKASLKRISAAKLIIQTQTTNRSFAADIIFKDAFGYISFSFIAL